MSTIASNARVAGRRVIRALACVTITLAPIVTGVGCGESRPARDPQELLRVRQEADARLGSDQQAIMEPVIARAKAKYDEYKAGKRAAPPTIDILIISGGGDWGAFGAAFLHGWASVPATDPLAKPEFDCVTGVSTGALIAPFAFLGDEQSAIDVETLYRNPKTDWVRTRGMLYFMPYNISFAEVPGLERELRERVTDQMVRRIAEAGADGRMLLVGTTNVDDGSPRVFDLVAEAKAAAASGDRTRIHDVMLASAGIPGAFPHRMIDGQMYVDGGITGNIVYGGRVPEEKGLAATWQRMYPDVPIPKIRFWVLFNNQFRPPPQVIQPRWMDVVQRALETSTRAATATAIRHLFANVEVSRMKRKADIEIRVASIPGDWMPPKPGTFIKETMNDLADVGLRMGADTSSWKTDPP